MTIEGFSLPENTFEFSVGDTVVSSEIGRARIVELLESGMYLVEDFANNKRHEVSGDTIRKIRIVDEELEEEDLRELDEERDYRDELE